MAYGDDLPSPIQRGVAFAAIMLAVLELAYCWLVAMLMAAAPNALLAVTSFALAAIVILNGALLVVGLRPANHWLRLTSWASIAVMIAVPTALVLVAG